MTKDPDTSQIPPDPAAPARRDIRRWRHNLADERAEASVYRELAGRRSGEEREILTALADAEGRHEAHWLALLGPHAGRPLRAHWRTRILVLLARRLGGVFVLALAQQAESRSSYDDDADATPAMAADERIHGEVIRALATRGRMQMSGTFRAAVFGANDGLVSNLALILGIGASGVPHSTVLLSGLSGLLAGALSMGAGEYVSVRSQRELLAASDPSPEASAALGHLDVDANELALVYRARGYSPQDAEAHAAEVLSTYTAATVIAPAGDDHEAVGTALGAAASSFCFFASGALVPVLPFLLGLPGTTAMILGTVLVAVALCITGATVGVLSGTSPVRRALRQLAIGLGAAGATYALGLVFGATIT